MKTTHFTILTLAALAAGLGLAQSGRAQQADTAPATTVAAPTPTTAAAPAAAPVSYGLLGDNWSEVDIGWIHQSSAPKDLHDYAFTYNQSLLTDTAWGLDGDLAYDYLRGSADGNTDSRNRLTAGLTGYLNEGWGKPFLSADFGGAWDQAGGISNSSYAYGLSTGVEFQVVRQVVVSPFIAYEATPHLTNEAPAIGSLDDHELTYGVKGTYRFVDHWSTSLALQQDSRRGDDLGAILGVAYHF